MDNNELYHLIALPEEVIHKLNTYAKSRKSILHISVHDLIEDSELMQKLDQRIRDEIGEDEDGIGILWEELSIAVQSYEEYEKKEIPVNIFIDTMKFCTRFLLEYHKLYSRYCFIWGWWFPRQLSLREFRIDALEYEYNSEQKRIYIHIPSDADFSCQSVMKSIFRFKSFCRQYYPEREGLEMWCESWLLSPALNNILENNSHILAFQKLFRITEIDYESMAVLDWVFPGYNKVTEELPEETSLQKNMKKYLLDGNKIGWAKGCFIGPRKGGDHV